MIQAIEYGCDDRKPHSIHGKRILLGILPQFGADSSHVLSQLLLDFRLGQPSRSTFEFENHMSRSYPAIGLAYVGTEVDCPFGILGQGSLSALLHVGVFRGALPGGVKQQLEGTPDAAWRASTVLIRHV